MKHFFLIFLFAAQCVYSQSGFEQGNRHYREGQYEQAVLAYESVLRSQKESAAVYFNLGNAYYKLNQIGPAIYHFEKALLLDPNDREIKDNLAMAQKMQIDSFEPVSKLGLGAVVSGITSAMHYDSWAWAAAGIASLAFLFFCVYFYSGRSRVKRFFFAAVFACIGLMVLCIGAAGFEKMRVENERFAIVFAQVASVKSEPMPDGSEVVRVHEGTKVGIVEFIEGWHKVELPDGNQGWIASEAIRELR